MSYKGDYCNDAAECCINTRETTATYCGISTREMTVMMLRTCIEECKDAYSIYKFVVTEYIIGGQMS